MYAFILVFFLLGCTTSTDQYLGEELLEPLEVLEEPTGDIQKVIPVAYSIDIEQDSIQKQSIKIILQDFYIKDDGSGGKDYYFVFKSEDTILDEKKSKNCFGRVGRVGRSGGRHRATGCGCRGGGS